MMANVDKMFPQLKRCSFVRLVWLVVLCPVPEVIGCASMSPHVVRNGHIMVPKSSSRTSDDSPYQISSKQTKWTFISIPRRIIAGEAEVVDEECLNNDIGF